MSIVNRLNNLKKSRVTDDLKKGAARGVFI
jgi:hypothetical protein